MAFTLNDIYLVYVAVGQLDRARAALEEAQTLWRKQGNQPMLADNFAGMSSVHMVAGEYDTALAAADESFRISQAIGNPWGLSYSRYWIGPIYLERGDPTKSIEVMEECIRLAVQAGFVPPQVETRVRLAWVYADLGAPERGLELAEIALRQAEKTLTGYRSLPLAARARVWAEIGQLSEAEQSIRQARAVLEQRPLNTWAIYLVYLAGAYVAQTAGDYPRVIAVADEHLSGARTSIIRSGLAEMLLFKGKALRGLGREEEALRLFYKARDEAVAIGSRRVLWSILAALADLVERAGQRDEASRLRQEAVGIIEFISARIASPELRRAFLNRPEVRALTLLSA